MKQFVLALFIGLLSFGQLNAQCSGPTLSNSEFNLKRNNISSNPSAIWRFNQAETLLNTYCLSSVQVAEIAALFDNDYDRLEFAKLAYPRTTDKNNFYEVYNAFYYFSSVFKLHDFVTGYSSPPVSEPIPPVSTMPIITYPDHHFYSGYTGCPSPLPTANFEMLLNQVRSMATPTLKLNQAKTYADTHCLTVAQMMRFGQELGPDNYRFDFLKYAYNNSYDRGNYNYSRQLLSDALILSQFDNWMYSLSSTPPPPPPVEPAPCVVTAAEFAEMTASIDKQTFNNSRLNVAKQIISANCLSSAQIKEVVMLMDFESSKLEVAKYAYDYVLDPENYWKVNDAFDFSSSIDELNEYIGN